MVRQDVRAASLIRTGGLGRQTSQARMTLLLLIPLNFLAIELSRKHLGHF